jgi:HPt (histidine-containing phosphotransfer) domain-containing protein
VNPEGDPNTFDASVIDALRAYGSEPGRLLDNMLRSFLAEAPALLGEIAAATDQSDEVVGRAVHRLHGAAGFLGASSLSRACAGLDHSAWEGDRDGLRAALAAIPEEVERAVDAARLLLQGAPRASSTNDDPVPDHPRTPAG